MSSVTTHERPGVYSAYDASSVVRGRGGSRTVAIAAKSEGGTAGTLYRLGRYEEAVTAFGAGDSLTGLVRLLFLNGAGAVLAVPVEEDDEYEAAFALLAAEEDVAVTVCDSATLTVQQDLRDSVEEASGARRERIAVVPGGAGETAAQLAQRAGDINSERVVLAAPCEKSGTAGSVAAAVAGVIAGESDPALPLGGAEVLGLGELERSFDDNELDTLILGGVTALEQSGGETTVVRGITTRTKTGEAADATWRELSTILIVDEVIPGIRNALRSRFRRAKNTEQSRGAIRSQVVLELEDRLSREIITGYDNVTVTASEADPTVCLVEFSFTVTHGVNQIWLTAHISV